MKRRIPWRFPRIRKSSNILFMAHSVVLGLTQGTKHICPSPPSLGDSFGLTCLIKCILPLVTSFLKTLASPKRDFEGRNALSEWQKAKNLDDVAVNTFPALRACCFCQLAVVLPPRSLSPKANIAILCHGRPRRSRSVSGAVAKHRANGVSHFELAEFFRPRFLVSV